MPDVMTTLEPTRNFDHKFLIEIPSSFYYNLPPPPSHLSDIYINIYMNIYI